MITDAVFFLLFVESTCIGYPVGVIIAVSEEIANQAASLVKCSYVNIGKVPIVTIQDAIAKRSFYEVSVRSFLLLVITFAAF